jgi:tetratricopeptide (TPR) repeat protein
MLCLEPVAAGAMPTHLAQTHGSKSPPELVKPQATEELERSPELLQAAALLAVGHDDDAMLALEAAVGRDPEVGEGWFQKGMLHVARLEWSEALLCLERALAIEPRDPRPWVAKFLSLEKVGGRSAEAARCLIRAADLDPGFTQRWIAEHFSEEELKEIRKRYGGGNRPS